MKEIYENGGIKTKVMGRHVNVVIWIHIITGDTSGHNDLCGHVNASSTKFPVRTCRCTSDELDDPEAICDFFTVKEVDHAKTIKHGLHKLSKKEINSCFNGVPLGDLKYGIMGITPPEMLHVAGVGIFKYMFSCLSDIIGLGKTKEKEKLQLDCLHQVLTSQSTHQSEKDFPRTSMRNGITDGTKMSGKERVGNMAILLCLTYTKEGRELLMPGLTHNNTSMKDFRHCMKLMLSFFQWVHQPNLKWKVDKAQCLVVEMLTLLKHCFPRHEGNGWKIPKYHLWCLMLRYVKMFGSASVFDGSTGERFLKSIVKDLVHNTQKVPAKLVEQLSVRKYDLDVIEHGYAYGVKKALELDYEFIQGDDPIEFLGRYTMFIHDTDHHGRGRVDIEWKDPRRNKIKLDVNIKLKLAIKKFALDQKWTGAFQLAGYTSYQTKFGNDTSNTIFHANEFVHGGEWYDWCMVQFIEESTTDSDTISSADTMAPAQILGFVKYESKGIPTPHLINNMGLDKDQIDEESIEDNTTYVVVHASSKWLSMNALEKEFAATFVLGDVGNSLYIVDVKCIIAPLFVVWNENETDRVCMLPFGKWNRFFDKCLEDE